MKSPSPFFKNSVFGSCFGVAYLWKGRRKFAVYFEGNQLERASTTSTPELQCRLGPHGQFFVLRLHGLVSARPCGGEHGGIETLDTQWKFQGPHVSKCTNAQARACTVQLLPCHRST